MSSYVTWRDDKGPWYAEDAVAAERVDKAIREGRAVKILRPDDSVDGKWEAITAEFHVWADSFAEMHAELGQALGVDTADSPAGAV